MDSLVYRYNMDAYLLDQFILINICKLLDEKENCILCETSDELEEVYIYGIYGFHYWLTDTILQNKRFRLLTTLNASGNDKITNDGIKGLPLTTLDASYSKNITDDGIKGLPLTTLYAECNRNITDDGIKGLPLTDLDASGNEKITDDGIKGLLLTTLMHLIIIIK